MNRTWVVFDLDGTLIESEQIWAEVRRDFVREHGGRWHENAQRVMMGMRTAEWARYVHRDLGVGMEPSKIAKLVVQAVVTRLSEDVPILPGADDALRRLGTTFALGLATSAALPVAQTVLAKTGWSDLFAVVVSSDEVARGKPAPDVYLRALQLLSADASRTAAIEDSASGIRAANAAGLGVVALPNRDYPPAGDALKLAARVLTSLEQLDARVVDDAIRTWRES